MSGALRADHRIAFAYARSVGGAVGVFVAGLQRGELWGSVMVDGSVVVPPVDWDPATGAAAAGYQRVGDRGVVTSWTWAPDTGRVLALIRPEGADTAMLHVLEVADPSELATGMTVQADWRAERTGSVLDIRAFVPSPLEAAALPGGDTGGPLTVPSVVEVRYGYEPGWALSGFFEALAERRITGGRCPSCGGVYVPPHPRCPACRTGPLAPLVMGDRGVVASFTTVHVPMAGAIDPPFVVAWIRLDGADVPFAHLLGGIDPADVQVGRAVEAVWVPDEQLAPTWESISHFQPVAPTP